jgi:hypothetical protein
MRRKFLVPTKQRANSKVFIQSYEFAYNSIEDMRIMRIFVKIEIYRTILERDS